MLTQEEKESIRRQAQIMALQILNNSSEPLDDDETAMAAKIVLIEFDYIHANTTSREYIRKLKRIGINILDRINN